MTVAPIFAPWNGTAACDDESDCLLDSVPTSVTSCLKFSLREAKGVFCACSKLLHLQGEGCRSIDASMAWDGRLQLACGVVYLICVARQVHQYHLRRKAHRLDPLFATFMFVSMSLTATSTFLVARGLIILGNASSELILVNRIGIGLGMTCFQAGMVTMVLSWIEILNTSFKRNQTLFGRHARRKVLYSAALQFALVFFFYLSGNFKMVLIIGLITFIVAFVFFAFVGNKLVKAFHVTNSGLAEGNVFKAQVKLVIERIVRLIRHVTISLCLIFTGSLGMIISNQILEPVSLRTTPYTLISIYVTQLGVFLLLNSVMTFVISARKDSKTTSVHCKNVAIIHSSS